MNAEPQDGISVNAQSAPGKLDCSSPRRPSVQVGLVRVVVVEGHVVNHTRVVDDNVDPMHKGIVLDEGIEKEVLVVVPGAGSNREVCCPQLQHVGVCRRGRRRLEERARGHKTGLILNRPLAARGPPHQRLVLRWRRPEITWRRHCAVSQRGDHAVADPRSGIASYD